MMPAIYQKGKGEGFKLFLHSQLASCLDVLVSR